MNILVKEQDKGVLYLTLNRPERRNAITRELGESIAQAVRGAAADPSVHVVVLTGAGVSFCGGADVNEVKSLANDEDRMRHVRMTASLQTLVASCDVPVIVAVNGAAVGAGAGLALSGDVVLMSETASFNFPELGHGMVPALVLPGLQKHLGRLAAFDAVTRGRPISAEMAWERRWVSSVLAPQHLMTEARHRAQELAALPRDLLFATKRLARTTLESSHADGVAAAVATWL